MRDYREFGVSGMALVLACLGTQAGAQVASQDGIADIVVTANRAPSTAQRTPATIVALSADMLASTGTTSTVGLQNNVPGLTFTSGNAGQTLIYLRGTGTSVLGLGAGSSVATYVDGVYYPNQQQGLQKFANVERIEVLKGPQATLFGRNATGGAINIITRAPSDEFSLNADLSYGNYDAVTARVTATGPVSDRLSALFSVLFDSHDGYNRNVTLGTRLGADKTMGIRGALKFDATPDVSFVLRGDYSYREFSDYVKDTNPDSLVYFYLPESQYIADPRKVRNQMQNSGLTRDAGVSGTLTADLGGATLTSITSYRYFVSGPTVTDFDSNDVPFIPSINYIGQIDGDKLKSRQFFHETYVATDRERPFFVTVGANYQSEKADQFIFRPTTSLYTRPGTVSQTYFRYLDNKVYSAFIDAGANLSEQLTLTAGVRYSHDDKRYTQNAIFPGPGIPAGVLSGRRVDKSFSPRFGIEYRVNPDLLLYATATSGFKSGGFAENDPRNSFKPEKVWSYEGGFKSTFWDRRARLNIAFFYADYRDIQVQQILGGLSLTRLITNADGAKLYGVDFEAQVRPVDGLTLSLNGEYLHSRIGNASLCNPVLPCSGATPPFNDGILDPKGNSLPNAPKFSLVGTADYEFGAGSGKVNATLNASYRSLAYFNYFGIAQLSNGARLSQPAYLNLDTQLRYTDNAGWYVAGYANNITNRLVRTWIDTLSNYSSTLPLVNQGTLASTRFAAPRTYGVRVGVSF